MLAVQHYSILFSIHQLSASFYFLPMYYKCEPTAHVQKYVLKIFQKVSLQFITLKVLRAKLTDFLKCLTRKRSAQLLQFYSFKNLSTRYLAISVCHGLLNIYRSWSSVWDDISKTTGCMPWNSCAQSRLVSKSLSMPCVLNFIPLCSRSESPAVPLKQKCNIEDVFLANGYEIEKVGSVRKLKRMKKMSQQRKLALTKYGKYSLLNSYEICVYLYNHILLLNMETFCVHTTNIDSLHTSQAYISPFYNFSQPIKLGSAINLRCSF